MLMMIKEYNNKICHPSTEVTHQRRYAINDNDDDQRIQ